MAFNRVLAFKISILSCQKKQELDSKNRIKTIEKPAILNKKVAEIRFDTLYKLTT